MQRSEKTGCYSCRGETLNNLADTKTSVFVIGMYCKQQKFVKGKFGELANGNLWKNFSQEILARLTNFTNCKFHCLRYIYVCTHNRLLAHPCTYFCIALLC